MSLLLLWHPRVAADADASTVYLDLLPISIDVIEHADDASVYLDLQAGSIFVQIDSVLEITGLHRRWVMEAPFTRFIIESPPVRRWNVVATFARWVMLETRRFTWRS